MQEHEALDFTLDRNERPVTINGEAYVLVELDGKERDKYLNNVGGRVRTNKDGTPAGVRDFDGLEASLIAGSLRKIENGERVPVDVATIQGWPARVVSALFKAAKDLSALGDEKKDDRGND